MNLEKEQDILTQPKTTSSDSTEELGFHLSQKTKRQLTKSKKIVLECNQDRVFVIEGREGLGKSKLARQLAYFLDRTLSLDRIVFNSKQFEEAIRNAKAGQAVIYDECFRGLSSKASLSKENKRVVQLLMECRQKNLFIFLVLPSFFMLDRYPAIFRSHALFRVLSSKKDFRRRHYKIYNYNQKKSLYLNGKATMNYYKPFIMESHRFFNVEPRTINEDEYNKKKFEAFHEEVEKEDKPNHDRALYKYSNEVLFKMSLEKFTPAEIARRHKEVGIEISNSSVCMDRKRIQNDGFCMPV